MGKGYQRIKNLLFFLVLIAACFTAFDWIAYGEIRWFRL